MQMMHLPVSGLEKGVGRFSGRSGEKPADGSEFALMLEEAVAAPPGKGAAADALLDLGGGGLPTDKMPAVESEDASPPVAEVGGGFPVETLPGTDGVKGEESKDGRGPRAERRTADAGPLGQRVGERENSPPVEQVVASPLDEMTSTELGDRGANSGSPSGMVPITGGGRELPPGSQGRGPSEGKVASSPLGIMERPFAGLLGGMREEGRSGGAGREGTAFQTVAELETVDGAADKGPQRGVGTSVKAAESAPPGEKAVALAHGAGPMSAADGKSPFAPLAYEEPQLRLPTGQSVPEGRILDQVVGRMTLSPEVQGGRMTLKLHPRELGEVQIDLVVEKSRVKAQLLAQNQQVQEVLEKHLPRLRSALEAQGLKLDALQVSVDSAGDGERGFFQEHRRPASPVRFALKTESHSPHEEEVRTVSLRQGGVNLRV